MMYGADWCFIHIPRTGGTFLTDLFGDLPHVSKCVFDFKHCTEAQATELLARPLGDVFTIIRDPWDIVVGWWMHIQEYTPGRFESQAWREYAERIRSMTFAHFVESEILSGDFVTPGGFVPHYRNVGNADVLGFTEAYWRLCQLTGVTPEDPRFKIEPKEFKRYDETRLTNAVREHCSEDMRWITQSQ